MEMAATPERADDYVLATLRNHEVVYGFGHRVYKTYDPRALIQKEFARQLADMSGDDRLYRIATSIEETVVRGIGSKVVYAHGGFYTGLLFRALGRPPAPYNT